jgi:hypothetical protein
MTFLLDANCTRCNSGSGNQCLDGSRGQEESESQSSGERRGVREGLAENFTPKELKRMKCISNGDYNYLGAAKIMAPIGKAFTDAMAEFYTTPSRPAANPEKAEQ